ncbi:MAG: translocation protein TolB [Deltaproteobacteria bacterium]|nr:MAG: translocation protein TolB [Deltaproteobacteria bacterium]
MPKRRTVRTPHPLFHGATGLALLVAGLFWLLPDASVDAQDPTPEPAPPAGSTVVDSIIEIPLSPTGERSLIPIAVPDLRNLGDSDPRGYVDEISARTRNALDMAGYFRVISPDAFFFDPDADGMTAATINFENWYNVGAQAVVKMGFRVATNQVRLDYRLFNVDAGEEVELDWRPVTVGLDEVAAETFRFINAIIAYYTGQPGVFGSRIAYAAPSSGGGKQIYTMQMDGGGISAVTSNRSLNILPAWGPGGDVMYTSYVNFNPDLYIGRNNARRLSTRPGLNVGAQLNPAGDTIAFTMTRDGQAEIYLMDIDGQNLRRLTNHPAEDVSPSWSPDGRRIAFVSDRAGGPQIHVMNADGSGQRRVTFAGRYNTTPAWSPTGDVIAFTGRDSRNRFDIFTVDPETSYIERLTQDQGQSQSPTWSPDGRWIAFTSTRDGGGARLYIMTRDGAYQRVVNPDVVGVESPRWEPRVPSSAR